MILDLGVSLYSWPTIYDAGPALNEHSASSTQSPDFMRLSLRLRVRLRRVHKASLKFFLLVCKSIQPRTWIRAVILFLRW